MDQFAQKDWDRRYREGDTPWDTLIVSRELVRTLDEDKIPPGAAIEFGCGSGTNAIALARREFDVTAADLSHVAIDRARQRAVESGVSVRFIQSDVRELEIPGAVYDFVFDRGCYHCVRKIGGTGYRNTLLRLTREGSRFLLLTGNANEQSEEGPPRLHEHEIRADLETWFHFDRVREFRFEDPGGAEGPLGWSCLLTRRPTHGS